MLTEYLTYFQNSYIFLYLYTYMLINEYVECYIFSLIFVKVVYVAPMKALAAEMTESFSKRLNPLGISVRELTGDMQLTKNEILQTQVG